MSDARVTLNGRTKITPRDRRLAGVLPHGIPERDPASTRGHTLGAAEWPGPYPYVDRPAPRAYRTSPGGHTNGHASASSIWSSDASTDQGGAFLPWRAIQGLAHHTLGYCLEHLRLARQAGSSALGLAVEWVKGHKRRIADWLGAVFLTVAFWYLVA